MCVWGPFAPALFPEGSRPFPRARWAQLPGAARRVVRSQSPATLGYEGYQYACCTSVNHVVCHGFPNEKKLRDGDIVNVDVTLIHGGWYGDSSRMYVVGKPKRAAERPARIT